MTTLTQVTTYSGEMMLIDKEDLLVLSGSVYVTSRRSSNNSVKLYATVLKDGKVQYVHRLIMKPKGRQEVDHIDGDGLNNSRSNLRLCSRAQNARNAGPKMSGSSKFKGVSWYPRSAKWVVRISDNGRYRCVGYFDSEIDAARAYNIAAKRVAGKFAYTNLL